MRALRLPTQMNRPRCAEAGCVWRSCAAWLLVLLVVVLAISNARASSEKGPEPPVGEHIVSVGDVHGDFDSFCLILKRSRLVDSQNHWIGGTAKLVQTGDLIVGRRGGKRWICLWHWSKRPRKQADRSCPCWGITKL